MTELQLTKGRADALWEWTVTLHEHGITKPPAAFREGEPVNARPRPLATWIHERLPQWRPRKRKTQLLGPKWPEPELEGC